MAVSDSSDGLWVINPKITPWFVGCFVFRSFLFYPKLLL